MSKNKEFKEELEKIVNIFFLCKESYLVLRELHRTENSSEYIIDLKYNNSFLILTKVNYWRVIVLQLSKLFIEKERYSLIKFLTKCKKGNYFQILNVDQEFIENELEKINSQKYKIDNIKLQRDKIFAHEDSNRNEVINDITLDEAKELLDLCQNIIFEIYFEILDTQYEFEIANSPEWNLKNLLKKLDEMHLQRSDDRKDILKLLRRKQ